MLGQGLEFLLFDALTEHLFTKSVSLAQSYTPDREGPGQRLGQPGRARRAEPAGG
ncbi:hypothetical protein GCM10009537_10100 [Corynebacterium riegelii]